MATTPAKIFSCRLQVRQNLLFILAVILWSVCGHARILSYKPEEGQIRYLIRNQNISFLVRHPFKVLKGTIESLVGYMVLDVNDIRNGLKIDATFPVESIKLSNEKFRGDMLRALSAEKYKDIEINISEVEVGALPEKQLLTFGGGMKSWVKIAGDVIYPTFWFGCMKEGFVFLCNFFCDHVLQLSKITLPVFWAIPSEPEVRLEGQISFVPGG